MANITISGLPAKIGTILDAAYLHLNESSVDKKVTIAQLLTKIEDQYSSDIVNFLDSANKTEARTTLDVYNKSESDNLITEATTTTQGISYLNKPVTITNNATDADHDMNFGAGNFDFDDGSGQATLSALTKQFDATFALGTNAGGMVSGESLPADGFVYVYQISNENGTITDIIGTTTADGSTISGDSVVSANSLTKKQYLGALPTDASSNIRNGNYTTFIGGYKFSYKNGAILNINTTTLATSKAPILVNAPPNTFALINALYVDSDTGVSYIVFYKDPNDPAITATSDNATLSANSNTRTIIIDYYKTDNSSQIYYNSNDSVAFVFTVKTIGWIEYTN